ncbi:alpha-amylase family protein [Paenibacillus koleovorans]|uniref:alpha-amylase family protein n=1 Tax=Paenibacillus koleovorans TaxID=121608 RepID=UPI000FD8A241|nr:alpha-amylase family protein [Paenibacillus koleovorans]
MIRIPTRQVHLDFHTSEFMPGVGEQFDKLNFQNALKLGRLNSITIFAKCHHSWSYYPTEAGMMHPTLSFDLTGAMIEAAHEIGVRAPVYITVGWSSNDAENHPEWVARKKDGSVFTTGGYDLKAKPQDKRGIVSWKFLCPNGGYADLIYAQTREICERYAELDGLFYDICFRPCWCESCLEGMKREALDPDKDEEANRYNRLKWQRLMTECTSILRERHPEATIFFNGGADPYAPEWHAWQSHFELEDLPTTWGGYDKMPPRAKFFARTGKDYVGQTGKFHTMWGEFGGFKPSAALRYECAAMLTYGARCEVGDQMHPGGEMDLETYRLIGEAYQYVEKIEPWCFDAEETTRLGIYLSGEKKTDEGLVKILLEEQMDFDIVLPDEELVRYDCLILPDRISLDETEAGRLNRFIENGGGVLLTGQSGLNKGKTQFMVDIGAHYQGPSQYENDYLQLQNSELAAGLITSPFLFYEAAEQIWTTDAEILAAVREPYFNRTYSHYCSHQNTPYTLDTPKQAGAVRRGNVIYLAHPVCKLYFEHGAQFHRDYFIQALELIYRQPAMRVTMPSSGRARFVDQRHEARYVLHLLYATPIQRGRVQVIEDLPPLYDVPATLRVDKTIKKAYLAPQGIEIPFRQEQGVVSLVVPKVECHQIVVLDY